MLQSTASLSGAAENTFVQFNSDVEKAYSAYRKALFQTKKNDGQKSGKANEVFLQQWKQIIQTYTSSPPEVFSSDPAWQATLTNIEKISLKSANQIKRGHLAEAHETLEAIRDELSDLRRRNSIIVFSDHINNYHEVMEGLLLGDYTPDKIDDKAVDEIRGQLAVLSYLAEAIKENGRNKYGDNQQYLQLEKNLFSSLKVLGMAIKNKHPEAISKAVKMLKAAYAKLFVNFG